MVHILVVEDNALVSGALQTLLEASGHRVSVAGSVAQAIAVIDFDRPALTLLDLTLPDGDGLGVARHLRSMGAARIATDMAGGVTGRVVALTGHDSPDIVEACTKAGCEAVLVKPVPIRELLAGVKRWVGEAD